MRLSDVMSAMDLTIYPKIGLVVFLGVFLSVCVSLLQKERRAAWSECAKLPLSDDEKR